MKIKRGILLLLALCFLISLFGCDNKDNKKETSEEILFYEKIEDRVSQMATSEEAIDIEKKLDEMSEKGEIYSFEWQDLIKNKKIVLSYMTMEDIYEFNNEYYVCFTYGSKVFRLKCSKEQVDIFVKERQMESESVYGPDYIVLAKVTKVFKPVLKLYSDIVDDSDKDNPYSEILTEYEDILIIEGDLLKAISHESVKS